jgi:hypothetical protein
MMLHAFHCGKEFATNRACGFLHSMNSFHVVVQEMAVFEHQETFVAFLPLRQGLGFFLHLQKKKGPGIY